MPRNSKKKADEQAKSVLDECLANYAHEHPEPRSSEAAILLKRLREAAITLKRLRIDKDDVDFARAFERVANVSSGNIIEWMVAAIKFQGGATDQREEDLAVFRDAVAAIPTLIRALEMSRFRHHDAIDRLKKIKDWLGVDITWRESALNTASPPATHSAQNSLRYFARMIDRHGLIELREGKPGKPDKLVRPARTADIALLASVALDNEINEKAVTAAREPI